MARNSALVLWSHSLPLTVLRSRRPVTALAAGSATSVTVVLVIQLIFSLARARSSMIFEARNSSRRCTMVTSVANLVRNNASSMALSPPPITVTGCPRKKNPSHVAHELTPCPTKACSDGSPSQRADAPEAMMSVCASSCSSPIQSLNGRDDRSARVTAPCL